MTPVTCKNKHQCTAAKVGPFWPVPCPQCGAEAAPDTWWSENPHGTTTMDTVPADSFALVEENAALRQRIARMTLSIERFIASEEANTQLLEHYLVDLARWATRDAAAASRLAEGHS